MPARTPRAGALPIVPLALLAGCAFVAITGELLPAGLILELSADLAITPAQAGALVWVFAAAVVVTAAPLTALTLRVPRRALLLAVLVIFAVGNLLAAFAVNFEMLLIARVVGGIAQGLFWAVVGAYAARLVPREKLARAVAITNLGGTAAFVLGLPLGAAIGQAVGWRWAFGLIAVGTLVLGVAILRWLPPVAPAPPRDRSAPADTSLIPVLILCVVTALVWTAHNVFYTYTTPFLVTVSGLTPSAIPLALLAYGIGGAGGILVVGAFADRRPGAVLWGCLGLVVIAMGALWAAVDQPAIAVGALLLLAVAVGGLPALLHARVLHAASPQLRDSAAAWVTTSFNVAIGGGAWLGGAILARDGASALPGVYVLGMALGAAVLLVAQRVLRRVH